jgi:hypothetical protein
MNSKILAEKKILKSSNDLAYFLSFQLNEFLKETGGSDISWADWQTVGKLSLDLRCQRHKTFFFLTDNSLK